MKRFLSIIMTGLLISFFSCKNNRTSISNEFSDKDRREIIDRETETWEYSKTKELDKLKEILADDYVGFFGRKTMNETDVIKSLQKATLKSYELIDVRIKPITKDAAIIYYIANQIGVAEDGIPWTPKVAAAATYVKRNETWYSVFYQETVLEK